MLFHRCDAAYLIFNEEMLYSYFRQQMSKHDYKDQNENQLNLAYVNET